MKLRYGSILTKINYKNTLASLAEYVKDVKNRIEKYQPKKKMEKFQNFCMSVFPQIQAVVFYFRTKWFCKQD